jgi:hypothetical protein
MPLILGVLLVAAVLYVALAAIIIYGIPLAIVLIIGFVSISIRQAELTSSPKAFRLLEISTNSSGKPWRILPDKIEEEVSTEWLSIAGWIGTGIPTLYILLSFSQSAGKPGEIITLLCALVLGIASGILLVNSYPAWIKSKIIAGVNKELERGVGGLEKAMELKSLSKEVDELYSTFLNTSSSESIEESFFSGLSPSPPVDFGNLIQKAIDDTKRYIHELKIAILALEDTKKMFRSVSIAVNRTSLGSLIVEMDDIYSGLHSEQLNDLVRARDWKSLEVVTKSFQLDLARIEQLTQQTDSVHSERTMHEPMTYDIALEVLGLGPDDSIDKAKTRYRDLVKQLHPDGKSHLSSDERNRRQERFRRVQLAWEFIRSGEIK